MRDETRRQVWQRNQALEVLLGELSELLAPAQDVALERAPDQGLPIVLVVGAPRSGTTLLMQWLAATGLVAYPTNLLSRFWRAPAIGARIQLLLTDPRFRFRDELDDLRPEAPNFHSDLGKTSGALAPNEFWYFWRRFLPTEEIAALGERVSEVDRDGLARELRALTGVFQKPFAAKGMMLQYDLPFFAEALSDALFLHVVRDPIANGASLLAARERFFGDRSRWYSAKPPEYDALADRDPVVQVAGQVFHTTRRIDGALAALPPERSLRVQYEDFCAFPGALHEDLRGRLVALAPDLDADLEDTYSGPASFASTSAGRSASPDGAALAAAFEGLAKNDPT